MSEAIFPLVGAAFVVLVVLPACALVARFVLAALDRRAGGAMHGLNTRYVVLVGSTMLPVAWLLSAGLHQAESGRSIVACLLAHDSAGACLEPGLFALTLGLLLLAFCWRTRSWRVPPRPATSPRAAASHQRIAALLGADEKLAWLANRFAVTEAPDLALATQGLWRPTIVVGASFAEALDDAALLAAFGHEAEHVRSRDPLRYMLLDLALAANPLGACLLAAEAARWRSAREAHCDREAVIHGAAPLSLAEAMVAAARPDSSPLPALGPGDTRVLAFRVGLLVAFAERPPRACCHRGAPGFLPTLTLLILALLLPHQAGTVALDALHLGAEQAVSFLWR